MPRNSKEELKAMATEALKAGKDGDIKFFLLVTTLASVMGMHTNAVVKKIEELAETGETLDD